MATGKLQGLMAERVWLERPRVDDAERKYYSWTAKQRAGLVVKGSASSSLVNEILRARQVIQTSLNSGTGLSVGVSVDNSSAQLMEVQSRLSQVEQENRQLTQVTNELKALIGKLEKRVEALEKKGSGGQKKTAPSPAQADPAEEEEEEEEDEDDFDLFGSDDEESEEAERLKQQRLQAYQDKKNKKPGVIAKSSIVLDVKPWDDETDMKLMEVQVRSVACDGLLWGASKLVELAYGIKKLQISCVVEDDKVGTDFLEESISAFEDLVQSVDIAAFNKI